MRGHIIKRYENSYTIVLNLGKDPATGKRKQQWISIKGTKKDAEKKLAELLHQLDTGFYLKPDKTMVADYLERWLKDYAKAYLSPRTWEGYESIIRVHVIPALGKIPISLLKPEHIQKYYADKLTSGRCDGAGGLKSRTVRHHAMCLHCALDTAVKWGLIPRNPSDAVDPPPEQHTEMHTMNEDDIHTLLECAKGDSNYTLFYTAIYTGMRRLEILGLRWGDVDLLLCQVSVNRSLHRLHDGSFVFRQPKTAKGRRLIALPPSAAIVLQEHKEKQIADRIILGTTLKENDLVFCQLDGKPLHPDIVTHDWIRLARKVGLKNIRLHDIRHTFASLMLKNNVHPAIVQQMLGHASIQITIDTYSHIMPGLQEAAAVAFDKGLAPKTPKDDETVLQETKQ